MQWCHGISTCPHWLCSLLNRKPTTVLSTCSCKSPVKSEKLQQQKNANLYRLLNTVTQLNFLLFYFRLLVLLIFIAFIVIAPVKLPLTSGSLLCLIVKLFKTPFGNIVLFFKVIFILNLGKVIALLLAHRADTFICSKLLSFQPGGSVSGHLSHSSFCRDSFSLHFLSHFVFVHIFTRKTVFEICD